VSSREIQNILRLTPEDISSTPFPTLLRQHHPKQFVDEELFGTYNTACTFIKHMKYDKAELIEFDAEKGRTCVVCNLAVPLRCSRCAWYIAPSRTRKQRGRSTRGRAKSLRPITDSTSALPS